jgi:hypothetical protein
MGRVIGGEGGGYFSEVQAGVSINTFGCALWYFFLLEVFVEVYRHAQLHSAMPGDHKRYILKRIFRTGREMEFC